MSDFCTITITTPTLAEAKTLSQFLVTNRWIACVNIVPAITSIYEWQGQLEESTECLMIGKTRQEHIQAIMAWVKENHSYTCPEIIVTPIIEGHPDYLAWVQTNTQR